MGTNKANTVRKIRILIVSVIAIITIMLLASCGSGGGKAIVEHEVLNAPEVLYVEEFDAEMNNIRAAVDSCNIKLLVKYDDDTSEEIQLKFDMLEDEFKEQLNSQGHHYIAYMYKDIPVTFEISVQLVKAYTVRFYDNNNNIISEQRVRHAEAAVEPTEDERKVDGYEFVEWDKSFNKVVRDLDIHGIYNVKTYTVRFYDNNNNIISEQSVKHGEAAIEPTEDERKIDGCDFVKWDKSFNSVTSDLNIYGIYDEKVYTVRFYDNNNTVINEQRVNYGESAIEPSDTEKSVSGYKFIGWDKAFDNITSNLDVIGIYEKLIVVTFYNCKNTLIETQYVQMNGDATSPSDAAKYVPGYKFLRWDAELTNIQADTAIYGVYINDTVTDTDGDGIIDYIEIEILRLDYTKVDTDGDGITDDKEDTDGDGLSNITEIRSSLKPNDPDTDKDGLTDGDEVDVYWTLPEDPDTDGDGAKDGWEVANGFDPLDYNDSFDVQAKVEMPDNTEITIEIPELSGEYVDTTIVEASTDESIKDVHGSLGEAIQYNISASATITIASEELQTAEDPVLMYFNTETKQVEPISVSVSGNEATANITKYGSYVLVDRKVFEEKGQWRDVYTSGNYTSIEIVFVIDDSGSLSGSSGNDPYYVRLDVAKELINELPSGAKVGVVRFDSSVTALTSTLTTKEIAASYLTKTYFDNSGNTKLYGGAMKGLELYSTQTDSDGILRVMILLSDGKPVSDSSTQSNVINSAKTKGVKIYTVGLGNSSSASFDTNLKPLSDNTGAKYYHSSNASALTDIYYQIGEKIDMTLDTDADGLADFFESGVDANGNPTLPTINGISFVGLDKLNPDTDGDGYLDGKEIEIYQYYSDANPNRVMIWGIVNSDPTDPASIPVA